MPPTDGITPPSPATISTCDTLSAGSAAFILAALALGAVAQPPGSLVVPPHVGHWRIWRLSPLFCGLEGLTILFFLVQAPFIHVTQRKRAFTIMAKRTTTTHKDTRPLVEILGRPKLELVLPMMLQIWKVVFIRGSKITIVMALLYWIDWAAVQYCHCWVYFKPITKGKSKCGHTVQRGSEGDGICKREWDYRGEAGDYVEVFAWLWDTKNTFMLWSEAFLISSLTIILLRLVPGSETTFTIVASITSWYSTGAGFLILSRALFSKLFQHRSVEIKAALFAAYRTLSTFVLILVYYKFYYNEAGTYKPAWLDWFG